MAQTLAQVRDRLTKLYALYDSLIANGGVVQKSSSGPNTGDHSMTFMTPKQVMDQIKDLEATEADLDPNRASNVAYAQFTQPG